MSGDAGDVASPRMRSVCVCVPGDADDVASPRMRSRGQGASFPLKNICDFSLSVLRER